MAHAEVKHPYHLVNPSGWPIVGSIGAFTMLMGAVFWMNKDYSAFRGLNGQPWIFSVGFVLVLYTMALAPSAHTNAYLIGHDPAYLLDPGPTEPAEQVCRRADLIASTVRR